MRTKVKDILIDIVTIDADSSYNTPFSIRNRTEWNLLLNLFYIVVQ